MRLVSLTLESVTETAGSATEFTFTPRQPLPHRAGQAGFLLVPGGGGKPFSLASDERDDRISIATTLTSGSRFKRALAAVPIGGRVRLLGAFGSLPPLSSTAQAVLVAQGIGITPFLAMARSQARPNAALLQVGAPHFFDEVALSVRTAGHFDHRDELTRAVAEVLGDNPVADWSLSGSPDFVRSVSAQLRAAGVPRSHVHTEAFWTMRGSSAARSASPDGVPAAV